MKRETKRFGLTFGLLEFKWSHIVRWQNILSSMVNVQFFRLNHFEFVILCFKCIPLNLTLVCRRVPSSFALDSIFGSNNVKLIGCNNDTGIARKWTSIELITTQDRKQKKKLLFTVVNGFDKIFYSIFKFMYSIFLYLRKMVFWMKNK